MAFRASAQDVGVEKKTPDNQWIPPSFDAFHRSCGAKGSVNLTAHATQKLLVLSPERLAELHTHFGGMSPQVRPQITFFVSCGRGART